ncbi:MAG: SMC-Scp complex subunit ScpB [Omnitrophica bacterium RBG_13_46_9]|nr:MAG: SMC-Scp complex subunit ScpB [Omnitrophica bacterium RBG_13_46_9]
MIKRIIEALLFVSENPIAVKDLKQALDGLEEDQIREAVEQLRDDYVKQGRSFGIAELAGGYQIVTNPEFAPWINKLFKREETRLSTPALETLAIIAYRQPITRSEIEGIRGVNVDGVIKTLLDKDLIKIRGRKDAPGRPITYGTTDEFLKRFGLKGLEQLPKLREFDQRDLDFGKEEVIQLEIENTTANEKTAYESTPAPSGNETQDDHTDGKEVDENAPDRSSA